MRGLLKNKHIVLGVSGGIAAYKSADLVRRLREHGASIRVVMTKNAQEFITPLTMQAVSGYPVHMDLFDLEAEAGMGHIELARWADLILIAPATADIIAKIAQGEASDLLTTLILATSAPIALAPAMNQAMWKHSATQANLKALKAKNISILGPTEGSQACGDTGPGRMMEPLEIIERVASMFVQGTLAGKKVLITAGPTHEALDPIRFITNASSGKMGYALAEAAAEASAEVILISGPVNIPKPKRVHSVDVVSSVEMLKAVQDHLEGCDMFIGAAAVGDYQSRSIAMQKVTKESPTWTIELERTSDIINIVSELSPKPLIIGFAAETEQVMARAKAKRIRKKMDMIIANEVGKNKGMGTDDNTVTVLWQDEHKTFETMSKTKLARELIALIAKVFKE